MKVLRVRIRRGAVGESQMIYPTRYKAEEVDRNGLGPLNVMQSNAYSGHIARGGSEAWCIIVLEDVLADEYATDPDMEIIAAAQADTLMEQWRVLKGETEEVVKDPDRINAIGVKQATGTALTEEDLKALDVNDPTPGVNKRLKSLEDRMREVAPQ
jgi:hypothetical protein